MMKPRGRARYREPPTAFDAASGDNNSIQIQVVNRPLPMAKSRRSAQKRGKVIFLILLLVVAGFVYLSYSVVMENMKQQLANSRQQTSSLQRPQPPPAKVNKELKAVDKEEKSSSTRLINHDKCAFRSYPQNRLYGLPSKEQPKFLSDAAYIRGQLPIIINPIENDGSNDNTQTAPVKVCIDTTSWENLIDKDGKERLPFTDGHNPSVISLASNPYNSKESKEEQHMRLDPKHIGPLVSALPSTTTTSTLNSLYLGVTIFGGGQCKFGFTPEQVDEYRFSLHEEPQGGKRAVIAILAPPNDQSKPFQTLAQTTLLLERDATYGTSRRRAVKEEKTANGKFARIHQEFDDPRLFFHLGRVWVLYRNGPLFGYEDQIHNPIHFEEVSDKGSSSGDDVKFVAYVKASETVRICCGRNIALISEEPLGKNKNGEVEWVSSPILQALTWVDPVTVRDDVKMGDIESKLKNANGRRLEEHDDFDDGAVESFPLAENHVTHLHRRLGSKPNKSNIHGTNGYMVPLPSTGELMGIAHFHRPENRKPSEFALHGHHYTHAFFTIARQGGFTDADDIYGRPFKLKRLSNEFMFRANSIPSGETRPPPDGDIIQFASGLDVVGSDVDGQLIVSYGINDCEGGVFTLSMKKVQQMLLEVSPGQEVVDLMEKVKR